MSILFNRAQLLAKVETTFRVDAVPTPVANAILVEEPVFSADATILDRNNTKTHLSPDPGSPGRKIATVAFSHEVRHNGNLDGSVAGKLGTLLQGCGYSEAAITAGVLTIVDDAWIPVNDAVTFTFTKTTGYAGVLPRVIELEVTTGGTTGAAIVDVTAPAVGGQLAISELTQTVTDAMTLELGESCQITVTATGTLITGDRMIMSLSPPGFRYEPVSDSFDSLSIYVYYNDDTESITHILTGCRGTFTVEGEAGSFGKFNFTFTGDYVAPTDETNPTGSVFETTIPPQIELANMVAAGGQDDVDYDLCAQSFSIDAGNEVVPRECINDEDSLAGALITGRNPTASFNPEAELEATHPFWANLEAAARISFSVRVGSEQGNVCTFWAPYAQYSSLAYGNRTDIRVYDINMRLNSDVDAGSSGNDELRITFS